MQRILRNTDKNFIDLTHNSYLNLHKNKEITESAKKYIDRFSTSFTTSPLVGNSQIFEEIFSLLFNIYQKQATIFPSGFQTNISVVPVIINQFKEPVVIFDKLNHNSMYQGLKLSNKHTLKRYQNCNLNQLEDILKKHQNQNKLVFTESVFSMDGTILDMENFIFLKRKYGFFTYIDEAHSLGLFGENGYGLNYKYRDEIEVIMATFSKAIASQGGFLLTNQELQKNIINKATGLIYSTGLSPSNIGVAIKAFEILPNLDFEREKISKIVSELNSNTQIIPIICSSEENLTNAYNFLLEKNILTSIIRHPTVPTDKQRLRVCINSEVDQETTTIIKDALKNFSI